MRLFDISNDYLFIQEKHTMDSWNYLFILTQALAQTLASIIRIVRVFQKHMTKLFSLNWIVEFITYTNVQ